MKATTPYTIRPATWEDSRFIYELAMLPEIRAASTRSDEFTWEEHEVWYAEKLGNGLNAIWIMEVNDIPVGQVRYGKTGVRSLCRRPDFVCVGHAEIAISIDPKHWGKGYALNLLRETMPLACTWLNVDTLVALVLTGNNRSHYLFQHAGFRDVGKEWRLGKEHTRYEWHTSR